jgi:hypothetical protein
MSDTGWIGIMYCVIFYFGGVLMGYLISAALAVQSLMVAVRPFFKNRAP